MNINPLTFYIEVLRDLMALGQLPTLSSGLLASVVALLVLLPVIIFFNAPARLCGCSLTSPGYE